MATLDVQAVQTLREIEGLGFVVRAHLSMGVPVRCWTDDAELVRLLPMDRPLRLTLEAEPAPDEADAGARLVSWEVLPRPVVYLDSRLRPLSLVGYRRGLRGRRGR